jgi:hypothetical protein
MHVQEFHVQTKEIPRKTKQTVFVDIHKISADQESHQLSSVFQMKHHITLHKLMVPI